MKLKLKRTKDNLAHKMYCREIQIGNCFITKHHPTSLVLSPGLLTDKENYIMIFNNEDECVHTFNKIMIEDQIIADIDGFMASMKAPEYNEYAIFNLQQFEAAKHEIKFNRKVLKQIVDAIKEHSEDAAFTISKEDEKHFGKDDELTIATIINMMHSNPRFANWIRRHPFQK